jgi:hypothetical protein
MRFLRYQSLLVEGELQDVPIYVDDEGQEHAFPILPSSVRQLRDLLNSPEGWTAAVDAHLPNSPDRRPPQVG